MGILIYSRRCNGPRNAISWLCIQLPTSECFYSVPLHFAWAVDRCVGVSRTLRLESDIVGIDSVP